jgi:hypothetical protein
MACTCSMATSDWMTPMPLIKAQRLHPIDAMQKLDMEYAVAHRRME